MSLDLMAKQRNSIIRLLRAHGKALSLWTVMISFVVIIIDLSLPFFNQIFTDSIITKRHPEWIAPMCVMLIGLFVSDLLVVLLLNYHKRRMQLKFLILTGADYFWHGLCMPVTVFSKLNAAVLQYRLEKGYIAAMSITYSLLPVFVAGVQIIIMLVVMLMYSPLLSFVSFTSLLLNLALITSVKNYQKRVSKNKEKEQSNLQSAYVSSISNIESVKAAGAESAYFRKLMGYFSVYQESAVRVNTHNIFLSIFPQILQNLTTILILCLGGMLIIDGEITLGILIAFQNFSGQFMRPLMAITKQTQNYHETQNVINRYYEVMDQPTDVPSYIELVPVEQLDKLSGLIELKNVTFGYDRNLPPLIKNLSLTIQPGQSLALVGSSGSGKSTIASLISGLYEPWEGEILFDGKPRSEINRYAFYNSVAVINQDITLFEGSVADNIKMWDEVTEDFAMVMASEAAQIHQDIAKRPDGYNSPVDNGGSNFSGGQRQRIEIATALTKEPTIMVMDEATSALDPATEAKVMCNIREQGITLVIVAHRLSTIRDCEEIIVMNQGQIDGRGTHNELMLQKQGLYYQLMQMN